MVPRAIRPFMVPSFLIYIKKRGTIMNTQDLMNQIQERLNSVSNLQDLNNLKVEYLGKTGIITELQSKIKEIPNEEKKEYGMKVNEVRTYFNNLSELLEDYYTNIDAEANKSNEQKQTLTFINKTLNKLKHNSSSSKPIYSNIIRSIFNHFITP